MAAIGPMLPEVQGPQIPEVQGPPLPQFSGLDYQDEPTPGMADFVFTTKPREVKLAEKYAQSRQKTAELDRMKKSVALPAIKEDMVRREAHLQVIQNQMNELNQTLAQITAPQYQPGQLNTGQMIASGLGGIFGGAQGLNQGLEQGYQQADQLAGQRYKEEQGAYAQKMALGKSQMDRLAGRYDDESREIGRLSIEQVRALQSMDEATAKEELEKWVQEQLNSRNQRTNETRRMGFDEAEDRAWLTSVIAKNPAARRLEAIQRGYTPAEAEMIASMTPQELQQMASADLSTQRAKTDNYLRQKRGRLMDSQISRNDQWVAQSKEFTRLMPAHLSLKAALYGAIVNNYASLIKSREIRAALDAAMDPEDKARGRELQDTLRYLKKGLIDSQIALDAAKLSKDPLTKANIPEYEAAITAYKNAITKAEEDISAHIETTGPGLEGVLDRFEGITGEGISGNIDTSGKFSPGGYAPELPVVDPNDTYEKRFTGKTVTQIASEAMTLGKDVDNAIRILRAAQGTSGNREFRKKIEGAIQELAKKRKGKASNHGLGDDF